MPQRGRGLGGGTDDGVRRYGAGHHAARAGRVSLLRQLREHSIATPVLLLSARGEVNERVDGLNAGADDYLPKPFVLAELVARVRALGRRGSESKPAVLQVADLRLDTQTRRA